MPVNKVQRCITFVRGSVILSAVMFKFKDV